MSEWNAERPYLLRVSRLYDARLRSYSTRTEAFATEAEAIAALNAPFGPGETDGHICKWTAEIRYERNWCPLVYRRKRGKKIVKVKEKRS